MRYQILPGGQGPPCLPKGSSAGVLRSTRPPAGSMEARGNFSGRQYAITRDGMLAAAVSQLRALQEQFAVEVADGQDALLMLAVVLVIETIRADRRRSAGG